MTILRPALADSLRALKLSGMLETLRHPGMYGRDETAERLLLETSHLVGMPIRDCGRGSDQVVSAAVPSTRIRLAAAAAALVVGVTAGAAIPSPAAAAAPDLFVSYGVEAAWVDNSEQYIPVYVYNYGDVPATDVTVTFDASGLRDVTIKINELAEGCTLAAAVVTCSQADLAAGQVDTVYPFSLASKPRSATGPAGTLKATIRSTAPDGTVYTGGGDLEVEIVPTGPDLVAVTDDLNTADTPVGPGDEVGIRAALYNNGDRPAEGFYVRLQVPVGSRIVEEYEDCTYTNYWSGEHPDGYAYGPSEVVCTAPLALQPGDGFLLYDPDNGQTVFTAHFGKNLAGPAEVEESFEVGLVDDLKVPTTRAQVRKGTGRSFAEAVTGLRRKTTTAAAAREVNTADNVAYYKVWTKPNTHDFTASATKVTGAIGDTVTVPYTLVNNGPSDGGGNWRIVAPSGTVLVRGDDGLCYFLDDDGHQTNELPEVLCSTEGFWPATASGYGIVRATIKVRIISTPGDNGTITVTSFGPSTDPNPNNNVAPLAIDLTGGGGGGLPVTGAKAGMAASAGAAAIAIGLVLYVFARRRRIITVTPSD
jgi:hypothetical protein